MNRRRFVLKAVFEELALDLSKTDFFITHMHADHGGLVSEFITPTSKVYCRKRIVILLTWEEMRVIRRTKIFKAKWFQRNIG